MDNCPMGLEKNSKEALKNKKVVCSYYHFDFDKFNTKSVKIF